MLVWLVKTGEPLPIDYHANSLERLHRMGILADLLVSKGHQVVWFSSTINHQKKILRFKKETTVDINESYRIVLLHSLLYKKNICIKRFINHNLIGRKFSLTAPKYKKPDLILTAFPTIDLSFAAVNFGRKNNIPVVVDVRDLWPDTFLNFFQGKLQFIFKNLLRGQFKKTREIFKKCTTIIGISDEYLEWALSYGERKKSPLDIIFPLGYQKPTVTKTQYVSAQNHFAGMGIDSAKIICWFIGSFGRSYDLETIIKAARLLSIEGRQDILFVFSGDGDRKEEWVKKAAGLDNVIFTGWVDSTQITYLMDIANIGLMAYASDASQGLPNKLFEYLCAGVAIMSSLQTETKDFIAEHQVGLTYKPGETGDFISKLKKVADDQKYMEIMGEQSKKLFKEKYDASKFYLDYIEHLEYIVQRHKSTWTETYICNSTSDICQLKGNYSEMTK